MAEEQLAGLPPKEKRKLVHRLLSKYRLVIMNDDTLEEKASLRLSPLNVFVLAGTTIITLITFTIYIIAFTDLREYIPGYSDVETQRLTIANRLRADSLEKVLESYDKYILNLKNIGEGNVGAMDDTVKQNKASVLAAEAPRYDTIRDLRKSTEDSLLRKIIEAEDQFYVSSPDEKNYSSSISSFFFFTPVKGTITNRFDPRGKHYGIDIVAPKNEPIKTTLDGTVIFSGWTSETGHVITIQHSNNLISVYKHNSSLLKKTGAYVKAGEVVAIIGNSGELSTGPHLHFELWYNGTPINPQEYMVF